MEKDLYDQDLRLWAERQAKLLRDRKLDEAQFDNIAEELESLARQQVRELHGRLESLCMWMLLWELQPSSRRPLWYSAIVDERTMLRSLLDVSPSLRVDLPEELADAYANARTLVMIDMDRDIPLQCPWTFDELMQVQLDKDRPLP
jgi:Domain of unknown function DUF29